MLVKYIISLMEKPNKALANEQSGRLLYDTIMEGMSLTAAVIRTNVFEFTTLQDNAVALRATLRLLEDTAASKKDEVVRKAEKDVIAALKRFGFLGSNKRAEQLDAQLTRSIQKHQKTTSSERAFVRKADTNFYSAVDGTATKVTGIPKKKK